MVHLYGSTKFRLLIAVLLVIVLWQLFQKILYNDMEELEKRVLTESMTPILVAVYYEALCPDSKHFIIKQLQTAYERGPELMQVQLVPYGKATTTISKDGSLKFECQHGPIECQANIYHACTIEAIENPKVLLDVVSCMIRNNIIPKDAMQKCTAEHKIDSEPIQKCYDSPHGAELLKLYGELQSALRPTVSFIPTITLDGSQDNQLSILKDLFAQICKVYSGHGPPPKVCQS